VIARERDSRWMRYGLTLLAYDAAFRQCGGFEVPPIVAANPQRNFKSKATLES